MRILHTSDWHLGKWLGERERMEEQRKVMKEICRVAKEEKVDVVVVAGDLYDSFNPSNEATELLYHSLHELSEDGERLVIAIAGNHDSPDRVEAADVLARECGIFLAGYPLEFLGIMKTREGIVLRRGDEGFAEFELPGWDYPLRVLFTPYANGVRLRQFVGVEDQATGTRDLLEGRWREMAGRYCDENGVNILVAHLLMAKDEDCIPDEPDDERPINIGGADAVYTSAIPREVQYVALGHLHRCQNVGGAECPVMYSGSPLAYSFAEAGQAKYVVVVDAEPGKEVAVKRVRLHEGKVLTRVRFENVDEAVDWLREHAEEWVELTIATDTYLAAGDLKRLREAHSGIVSLIPEVSGGVENDRVEAIYRLRTDMEALFAEYFRQRKGQEAGDEMKALFRELLSGI